MSAAALRLAELVLDDPKAAVTMASRIVLAAKQKRQRRLARSLPRRRAEADAAVAASVRHASLVESVLLRAGSWCELGNHYAHMVTLEPHHLEGGSGKRRQQERISNVMAACRACHGAFHANPRAFVETVAAWCTKYGYPLPSRREYRNG